MKYQNPILRGSHPDPSICKVDKEYYLVNSSFELLPGLPIYQSQDLVNWKLISYGIDNSNVEAYPYSEIKNSMGVLAPTIRYHNGKFYIVCTFAGKGTFIIESSNPTKGWSKPHWFKDLKGIDPSITFIKDKCYLQMTTGKQIFQCRIDPRQGKVISDIRIISSGTGGRDPEGPHVYYQFNKYWLLLAEGGTREGHMVTMQVSGNINGPYKSLKNNPILSNRDYKEELQCIGHADIVATQDNKFELVALAVREPKHVHLNLLGRETILLPVIWSKDEIIVNSVNGSGRATIEQKDPLIHIIQNCPRSFSRNNIVSVFTLPKYELNERKLLLLDNRHLVAGFDFIGVRQTEFKGIFGFETNASEKIGMMIYKDETHLFRCIYSLQNQQIIFYKQNSDLIMKNIIKLRNPP